MALNGLDDDALRQALQNAQAQPNGWILLTYKSRDEVETLSAGAAGVSQLSAAVADHQDPSPLYGYLRYRERNILLKIIPEGTSRLLQARTTVHFQSFSDAFESHDGVLTASCASEINEFAVCQACCLPVPDGVSAPQPDQPEGGTPHPQDEQHSLEKNGPSGFADDAHSDQQRDDVFNSPQMDRPVDLSDIPVSSYLNYEPRPSTSDSSKYNPSSWRPKVKLFTRPMSDERAVKASDNSRQALPQGMRILPRRGEGDRPRSSRSQRSTTRKSTDSPSSQAPPVPALPAAESPLDVTRQEPTEGTSAQAVPVKPRTTAQDNVDQEAQARFEAFSAADALPRVENTAAEKQRIMKALEQRRNRSDSGRRRSEKQAHLVVEKVKVKSDALTPHDQVHTASFAEGGLQQSTASDVTQKHKIEPPVADTNGANAPTYTPNRGEKPTVSTAQTPPESLQLEPNLSKPERESLFDDSFLEELQAAQLQRATPVALSRSPRSRVGEGGLRATSGGSSINPITVRSSSGFSQNTSPHSQMERARTVSHVSKASQDTVSLARVGNVSKGISQRIQALAQHSSREPSPNSQQRELLNVGNFTRPSSRGSDINRIPSRSESRAESPIPSSIVRKPKLWSTSWNSANVRSASSERRDLGFHGSLGSAAPPQKPSSREENKSAHVSAWRIRSETPLSPQLSRPGSRDSAQTNLTKHSVESSWKFLGRRKTDESRPPQLSGQGQPPNGLEKVDENGSEGKQSRAGRLLKRMSGHSSSSKKHERGSDQSSRGSKAATTCPPPFSLGDLNVQFPDSLLWKRRWVEVDASGYVVLSVTRANERPHGSNRRYHMNEFRTPIMPSHDRQELSNSIMFDFVSGGGTLQLAFQDATGQQHFLSKLLDSYNGWAA